MMRQFANNAWPILTGPIVVFAPHKNPFHISNVPIKKCAGNWLTSNRCAGNRDGPLIFHKRDGPPNVNGSSGGTGPPEIFSSGFSPPRIKSQPMD